MMNTLKSRAISIENQLTSLFKPVAPRRDFVRGLGHKIQVVQPVADRRATSPEFFLLILAGVLSMGMLVALLARFLEKKRSSTPKI